MLRNDAIKKIEEQYDLAMAGNLVAEDVGLCFYEQKNCFYFENDKDAMLPENALADEIGDEKTKLIKKWAMHKN